MKTHKGASVMIIFFVLFFVLTLGLSGVFLFDVSMTRASSLSIIPFLLLFSGPYILCYIFPNFEYFAALLIFFISFMIFMFLYLIRVVYFLWCYLVYRMDLIHEGDLSDNKALIFLPPSVTSVLMAFLIFLEVSLSEGIAGSDLSLQVHSWLWAISVALVFLGAVVYFSRFRLVYLPIFISVFGFSLAGLTGYSQFYYPGMVLGEAKRVVGNEKFCLARRGPRDGFVTSTEQLTFLTAPKSTWDAHFKLLTETKTYEWSYFKREFFEYSGNGASLDDCYLERDF